MERVDLSVWHGLIERWEQRTRQLDKTDRRRCLQLFDF
jgi:hypothetical protein